MLSRGRCMFVVRSLAVASLVVGAPTTAAAQPQPSEVSEGRGYLMIGAARLDLDDLNTRLASTAYPTFPESRLVIGAGGHGVRGRWVIGAEGHGFIGRTKDAVRGGQNLEAVVNGGYGFFDVGYLAARRGDLHVYPFGGIGGGAVQLRIAERGVPTFGEVLRDPGRTSSLTTAGFLLQVGLGVDRLFVLRSRDEGGRRHEGGVVLGVRAGWVFMPVQGDWRLNNSRVSAGPDVGLGGPFVRVMVGGGGKRSTR